MNEISQILESKERVIYDSEPEYAPYMISAISKILIVVAFISIYVKVFSKSMLWVIVVGAVILIFGIILSNIAYARTHYAISNKRAIVQSGIIGRDFKSIDFDKMQNVSVDVDILGAIFKVGTIKIFTGELTGGKRMKPKYDKFKYVNFPYQVLKQLQARVSERKESL